MPKDSELKEVYSVTELAAKLGFSRARFYQLRNKGVFPLSVYCPYTRRPFYTAELVQQCLGIRNTCRGLNKRSIVFNQHRKKNIDQQKQDDDDKRELFYIDVRRFFKEKLGENLTENQTKKIVSALFPNKLTEYKIDDKVVDKLIQYFYGSCKNVVK